MRRCGYRPVWAVGCQVFNQCINILRAALTVGTCQQGGKAIAAVGQEAIEGDTVSACQVDSNAANTNIAHPVTCCNVVLPVICQAARG
jgi:hypothetical protein